MPEKDTALLFEEQLFSLSSVLSNDVAQNTSPVKIAARVGITTGCCVGAGLWHQQSLLCCFWRPLSCTRDETQQTDGKRRLSSEDAFNFHKDDFVS